MPRNTGSIGQLRIEPADSSRWADLERLFGDRGACGGCWCMWFRLPRAEYEEGKGAKNRSRLRRLVASGQAPGILAYVGDKPIGWCAVAPRTRYARLERSRALKPIDDQPVWSIVCLFVAKEHRRRRISVALLRGAAQFAAAQGARIIEGYPVEPKARPIAAVFAATGTATAFTAAGFREVARGSPGRPIMRLAL